MAAACHRSDPPASADFERQATIGRFGMRKLDHALRAPCPVSCTYPASSSAGRARRIGAMARIVDIVIDCASPAALARFWAAALDGYAVAPYDEEELARPCRTGAGGSRRSSP